MTAMPRNLRIEITRADIEEGEPNSARQCAVSLAANRTLNEIGIRTQHITTIQENILVYPVNRDWGTYYDLPRKVATFIDAFDNGAPVKPIAFTARRRPARA
jgi:hypothetical protein